MANRKLGLHIEIIKTKEPRDIGEMLFGPSDDSQDFIASFFKDGESILKINGFIIERLIVNNEDEFVVWRAE